MVTVKFLLCNCPDLSQDFLDANHLSEYPSTTWHYKGYYKLDDYSYSVDDGDILDNWPETPEIEGYTKDGWGYIIYDPSTDVTTWYRIDPSTETIEPNDTHALFKGTDTATGNSVCYFTFVYSQTSSLPVITYKYGNEVLGTQVLGRFDSSLDDLQYPEEVGYDYVWDVPSTMPTTDTIIQATSRTLKTYNFTVQLVDRPWLYNANYDPSKTYSVPYGTNISNFISSSNDNFIKNWRDYDATEVPLWGTVSESSFPTTMPAEDVTYTRTYTVDSEHWHDVTMEFYTRSDDGTVTLESSSVRHLPYGYMIPPEEHSATYGNAHPSYALVQVQILDGAWHDYYAQKLATGYEFYDVEVNNPGNILEPGFTGINGLRDADATYKYYSAYRIASITLKTVDENGDTVSSKTITRRFEGDTLTSTDLEASDVTGKKFVLTPGIESYTISRNDTEIVIGTYRTLHKVYYKLGNKSLKIEKGVSEYDYVECYSGETINENVILLEHDIQSNTTNRYTTANFQDPHIRSFVYPNSVVNKVMPAQNIEVQIDLTYEHNLKIVFNNDTSDVIYSTKIFGGDEINLNYVAPEHLSRNDNVYRFNSMGQIPAVMPDEDVYISATYDLVYCITFATGSSEHITGQKYGYYVAGETIVYPEFGEGDDKMDMYFLMPYGQSGVRECKAIGWADAPETMPAADTTVYAEYEIKKHLNVEIYINNQVDYTFAIAGGYTGDTFDVFETLKNNYRFINYRWVYQGESNQYQDYRVDWNLSNLPETWTVGQSDVVVLTGNAYTRTQYRLICKVQSTGEVIKEYSRYPYSDLNIEDGEYFVYRTYSQNGSIQHDKYEIVNKLDMQVIYDKYTGKYMMPENDLIIYLNPVEVSYVRLYVKDTLWKTMVFPKNQYINFISLPIPTLEGYTFLGWRTPDQGDFRQYDRYYNTHDAVVFTAIFKEIEVEPEVYTITYMVDGEVWRTADYEAGQYIPNQLPPAKSGYHFVRWNPQVTQMPQFDVTVEAVYEQNQISDTYYSLEFYIDDTMVYQTEVRGGDVIPQPTVSVPDGKRVVWIGIPEYMPESNLRINGYLDEVTRPLYYINFYLDGTIYQRYGYYEGELVYPAEVPEKQGYVFRGWNNLPASMPANDIDIYGEYAKSDPDVGQKYSVIYKIDGRIWRSVLVDAGTEVGVADFPVRDGYVFTGWSVTESFVMPDHDVVISGAFTRSGDAGVYYINYYIPGQPVRTRGRKAVSAQYSKYREDNYYTGEQIVTPEAPEVENKVFVGWSGEPSRMGDHDVDVYGVYSQALPSNLTEITNKVPVFREKLVNSSNQTVRKGNKLTTQYGQDENYIIDDKNVTINRLQVVLPSGEVQTTNYYKVKSSSSSSTDEPDVQESSYIKIGDEYFVLQVMTNGTYNVVQEHPEETPGEFYELTDRVKEENGKYYELIKVPGKEEYVIGNELYIKTRSRAVYGAFDNGAPTLIEDADGKYTNWIYRYELYNNHNSNVSYTKILTRDLLEKVKVVKKTRDFEQEYDVPVTDPIYNYLWYPQGDFYSISKYGIELAAQNATLVGFTNVGSTLNGSVLTIYFLTETEAASGYSAIYIMDGDNRISMLTGKPGDSVTMPNNLTKLGYEFLGYEGTVPTVFPAQSVSVMTKWKKLDTTDDVQEEEHNYHTVTWKVPDHNWKYTIRVEVGETIPAAPEPDLDDVAIKSWKLTSTFFSGNVMPDFDVVYEAVVLSYSSDSYLISYYISYKTASGNEIQNELYAQYRLKEETPITPEPAPYKRGGTWLGWDDVPAYMPAQNVDVHGSFSGEITDTFNLNYFVDGVSYKSYQLAPGDAITSETEPTKSGYTFSGWIGLPNVMPAMEVNVNGYFIADSGEDKVTVKYMLDGELYKSYTMVPGAVLPAEPEPTKSGYTFSGWYPIYTTVPQYNVVISGTFYEGTSTGYQLEFYLNEELYYKTKLVAGEKIVQPEVNITGFTGWKNCPDKMPQKDLKIYGEVVSDKPYTVTYMIDGELFTTQKQFPGKHIVPPRAADKPGYTFDKWDGLPEDLVMPANDITATAVYTDVSGSEYTITFKVQNQVYNTQTLAPGDAITLPANPTVEGKVFDHWQGLPEPLVMPERNVTVNAIFVDAEGTYVTGTYNLEVVQADGSSSSSVYKTAKYTPGEPMEYMAAPPSRQNFIWIPWTSEAVESNNGNVPATDFDIYGKFVDKDSPDIPEGYYTLSWCVELNGEENILFQELLKPGDEITEPSFQNLVSQAGISTGTMVFVSWGNHAQTMPSEDLKITAVMEEGSGNAYTVNINHEYVDDNNTKTIVQKTGYTLIEGASFSYPQTPNPDNDHQGYIFAGWSGWNNNYMPQHDITITALFVSPEADHGFIDGYCRIYWYIPATATYLGAKKKLHKTTYVAYGQPITEPAALDNFTGDDGFEYRFKSWESHDQVAPSLAQISIMAVIERVPVQYNVSFTLTWYHSASNIEQDKPFTVIKAYPGDLMSTIKEQATALADATEGEWMFEGIWYADELPDFSDMGWLDRGYHGNMYSWDYATTANKTLSWRQIKWNTRSWSVHRINGELVGYVDTSAIYNIKTEWKRIGTAITEPSETIVAPFPHKDQFIFAGWEEHPETMPEDHLVIYAQWDVIKEVCQITWRLLIVAEDGTETYEAYKVTPQNQREQMVVEAEPAGRTDYIWAGWDLPQMPGGDFYYVVPSDDTLVVTGTFYHKNYSGGSIPGYGKVIYRLKTHDKIIPATPYIEYYTEFGKRGQRIPQCPTTPEDWDGRDGYRYHFLSWDNTEQTMPVVGDAYVTANDERVATQYTVTYYLNWYHSSSNIEQNKLYTTKQIYAGSDMSEADITPTLPSGYLWSGVWRAKNYVSVAEMPWYDIEMESDVYSEEYASGAAGLSILGYRYINWWSHGYDIQIDTWLPVARSNEDWQVCPKQWVRVGDPIVEPAGPFTPKFANGSKFTWDGWDTHPSVMPDENIIIWAKWRVIRNSCAITWRFELVDASGNKTYETFLTQNKNQGEHLVNSDIPTAPERSGYVWAGWEVPYLKPNEWLVVPFQDSWTLTGTYYSTDYSGYAPAGYSVVYYRTKTHNTALTGAMYNEFWHQLVKQGDPVPTPPNNPTTWRGTDGKLYKFVKWGSIPSKVPTSDLYIVAEDEKVPEQHNLGLYLEYYSGTRLWKTIGVLAGTSLEAAIVEAGEPDVGSNYVWDNIWQGKTFQDRGYMYMQDFDMNFVSKVYTLDYFLSYKPAADGVHIITWKSNYYNSSAIWTVKQEVVKTGAKIVPPTGVQMPNHEGEMYVSGWSPAVPETMPNQHLVFTAVWASGSGPVQPSTTCEISWWIYDRENDKRWYIGVENKYKYQEYGDVLKFPPHKSSSYLFLGWYDDNGETVYVPSQDKKEYGGAAGNWNTDYGKLSGYSRVYYMIPEIDASGITGNTTKYYMRYYYNGSVIDDSLAGTPSKINVGSDSYAFKYWISHETYAPTDGSDVIINAKYEKETYSGEATVNVYCRFLYYDGSSSNPTVLQDYTLLYTAKTSSTNDLKKIRIETPMHWELVTSNDNVWTTTDGSWWDGKIYSSSIDIRCTFRTYVENMPVPRAIQWDDWNIGYNWRTSGQNVNAGKKATFTYRIDGQVAFTYQADIASNLSYIPGTEEIQKYFKQQGISSSDKLESWNYTFGDQTHKLPDGYFVMYDSLTLDAVMQKPGHYMFYAKRFDTDDAPELISELWSSKDLNVYNEYFSYPRKKHTNGSIADPTSLVVTEWVGSYGNGQGQFFKGEHEVYYYYGIRKNVQSTTIPYLAKINLYGPQIKYTPSNQPTVLNENVDSFIGTYYGTVGETTPPAVSISSYNLPLYGYNQFVYYSEQKSITANTLSINLKNGYFTLSSNKKQKVYFTVLLKTGGSTRYVGPKYFQVGILLDIYKYLVELGTITAAQARTCKETHKIVALAYGPQQKKYFITIPEQYVMEDWSWMYQWSPMNDVHISIEPILPTN